MRDKSLTHLSLHSSGTSVSRSYSHACACSTSIPPGQRKTMRSPPVERSSAVLGVRWQRRTMPSSASGRMFRSYTRMGAVRWSKSAMTSPLAMASSFFRRSPVQVAMGVQAGSLRFSRDLMSSNSSLVISLRPARPAATAMRVQISSTSGERNPSFSCSTLQGVTCPLSSFGT